MPLFGGHRPGRRRDHDEHDSKKGSRHRSRSRRSRTSHNGGPRRRGPHQPSPSILGL